MLQLNGKDFKTLQIEERKAKLAELLINPTGVIRYSISFTIDIDKLLGKAKDLSLEGLRLWILGAPAVGEFVGGVRAFLIELFSDKSATERRCAEHQTLTSVTSSLDVRVALSVRLASDESRTLHRMGCLGHGVR